jgi:hypothetical protein
MSSKRRSFLSPKNMIVPRSNLSLAPLGTWLFPEEQLKPFFPSGICFHPVCSWVKKVIQEKV